MDDSETYYSIKLADGFYLTEAHEGVAIGGAIAIAEMFERNEAINMCRKLNMSLESIERNDWMVSYSEVGE